MDKNQELHGEIMATHKALRAAGLSMRDAMGTDGMPQSSAPHKLGRRNDPVLIMADTVVDWSAVKALASEWLVPLLIQDFLAEQDTLAKVHSPKPTIGFLGEEGAAKGRIR